MPTETLEAQELEVRLKVVMKNHTHIPAGDEKSDPMLWIQNHHTWNSYQISHIREKMVTDFDFLFSHSQLTVYCNMLK